MMAQPKARKISRAAKKTFLATEELESDDQFVDFISPQPVQLAEEVLLARTFEARQQQLSDLANLRDDGMRWFGRMWGDRVRSELATDIFTLRSQLRSLWGNQDVEAGEQVLDKWLSWRPSLRHWKRYRRMGDLMPLTRRREDYSAFQCSIESGRLVPDFGSFRAMLIQGVLEHWHQMKICANPDCQAPYFIAKRKDQTVCTAEKCKAEKQKIHALKWWRKNRARKNLPTTKSHKGGGRHGTI
jgi:hypothetical protein